MKRVIVFLLAVLMLASLCACSKGPDEEHQAAIDSADKALDELMSDVKFPFVVKTAYDAENDQYTVDVQMDRDSFLEFVKSIDEDVANGLEGDDAVQEHMEEFYYNTFKGSDTQQHIVDLVEETAQEPFANAGLETSVHVRFVDPDGTVTDF